MKFPPKVTIIDVARVAEVSIGTVSRVINNQSSVRHELRTRVLKAASQLGYIPNPAARGIRARSTRAVGVIVPDVSNPLFASTVAGAEEALYRGGYTMVLASSGYRREKEQEILALFRRRQFDGMIIVPTVDDDPQLLEQLQANPVPTVLLERESPQFDSVAADHYSGALQAFDYLFKLNHRRIGLITVTQSALTGRQRGQAYLVAYKMAGLPVDPALTAFDGLNPDAGYHAAYRMLVSPKPATAIVAGANQMPDVLRALRALRFSVPKNVSILSIGDTDLAGLHQPPLTVVRWEMRKVGAGAAELLLARVAGAVDGPEARRIRLVPELVLRASCAVLTGARAGRRFVHNAA